MLRFNADATKKDESAFYYLYTEQYASNEITSLIY